MTALKVTAHLVSGSVLDFQVEPDFLAKLQSLQAKGLQGASLIHELITDDWGAPPVFVRIVGVAPDGRTIDITIPYTAWPA